MKLTLNNKEVELTAEEVQKIVEQSKKAEEKKIEIKNYHTGDVIYSSSRTTLKEAAEEAVKCEADLREADLRGDVLYGADLREANLRGAVLYGADLREADLRGADLLDAKFYGKGGTTKISKSQVDDFFKALGVTVNN